MSQKVQYNQKVQECQSLRTVLGHFVTTPAMSTASLAAAHTGLLSTSRSSASPPSSRVASPTSSSYIALPLSRLGLSRSASVAPTPMRSASVAPTSSCSASTVPPPISTPGISTPHRSATPTVPSYCSSTPVSPSPVRKSYGPSRSKTYVARRRMTPLPQPSAGSLGQCRHREREQHRSCKLQKSGEMTTCNPPWCSMSNC
ncbi:hypothetical protein DFH94DRAFT_139658 [Russula ochroleuca]|uniref:Uncharacterized protein n=1 Tax=Russula ochroleuca TaxID=152965 RepID=A0A9P5JZE5_9AGAM|nr:hypothetical protein DFH94DRAFT_139658 [Russula ochroleuca]